MLSVSDDGCGIPAGQLHETFERYRHSFDARQMGRGAGLGLSVVRGVAQLHGGTLLLESREGQGARVSVSLPENPNLTLRDGDPPPGPRRILTELCDVLPGSVYLPRYLD